MEIINTSLNGLLIIKPVIFRDSRGYFFESFNEAAFRQAGLPFKPVQDNESRSVAGVVRGLHYQLAPHQQSKLIRVVEGKIFDVAVDLRSGSPTCGQWFGIELDSESKTQFFIPAGFAHGFSVLSETAIIQYKCDNYYSPTHERGIFPWDAGLDIDWKIKPGDAILSDKDMKHPGYNEAEKNF
jgi:dTDP-4-dehydrorhamnose 3,5-epimerase